MADIVDKETRSRMMSGIRGKDTKLELIVRKGLFHRGFRYRVHRRDLQGRPDVVLPKYRAVVFINGCFWHGHEGCPLFRWPETRRDWWRAKIDATRERDTRAAEALNRSHWRQAIVWECALSGKFRLNRDDAIDQLADWLKSDVTKINIIGNWDG
jgi:DNA mismatch endonuclease (patch repair protein)